MVTAQWRVPGSRWCGWYARRGGMLSSWRAELGSHNCAGRSGAQARWGSGMPIPRVVRQWNKAGLNRVTKHIAPWMPGFGVVVHRGRRSGRPYQTPVNVFRRRGRLYPRPDLRPGTPTGSRTSWPRAVVSCGRAVASSGWSHRACFTTRPEAASVPWNGRYCGLSASLTSCPSRPCLQPRQRLASPERLSTAAETETERFCYPPSSALFGAHDPYPPICADIVLGSIQTTVAQILYFCAAMSQGRDGRVISRLCLAAGAGSGCCPALRRAQRPCTRPVPFGLGPGWLGATGRGRGRSTSAPRSRRRCGSRPARRRGTG